MVLNDDRGVEISNLSANPCGIIPLWARAAYVTNIYWSLELLKYQNTVQIIYILIIDKLCEANTTIEHWIES